MDIRIITETICKICSCTMEEAQEHLDHEIRNLRELQDLGDLGENDFEEACQSLGLGIDYIAYFLTALS